MTRGDKIPPPSPTNSERQKLQDKEREKSNRNSLKGSRIPRFTATTSLGSRTKDNTVAGIMNEKKFQEKVFSSEGNKTLSLSNSSEKSTNSDYLGADISQLSVTLRKEADSNTKQTPSDIDFSNPKQLEQVSSIYQNKAQEYKQKAQACKLLSRVYKSLQDCNGSKKGQALIEFLHQSPEIHQQHISELKKKLTDTKNIIEDDIKPFHTLIRHFRYDCIYASNFIQHLTKAIYTGKGYISAKDIEKDINNYKQYVSLLHRSMDKYKQILETSAGYLVLEDTIISSLDTSLANWDKKLNELEKNLKDFSDKHLKDQAQLQDRIDFAYKYLEQQARYEDYSAEESGIDTISSDASTIIVSGSNAETHPVNIDGFAEELVTLRNEIDNIKLEPFQKDFYQKPYNAIKKAFENIDYED